MLKIQVALFLHMQVLDGKTSLEISNPEICSMWFYSSMPNNYSQLQNLWIWGKWSDQVEYC